VVASAPAATGLDPELHRALSALRSVDRELLALVAWEGLTPAQAGAVLGMS